MFQTFNLWLDLRPYGLEDVDTSPIQFNAVGMTSAEFTNEQVADAVSISQSRQRILSYGKLSQYPLTHVIIIQPIMT